jgi:predicted tellurium resistance membrane protein TerC
MLQAAGIKEIKCPDFTAKPRQNPPAVVIDNEAGLPDSCWRVIPEHREIDKRTVKDMLEFGDKVIRVWKDGAPVANATRTIAGLSQANPARVTAFGHGFSWRDLILIAGGLFLVYKATKEVHHSLDVHPSDDVFDKKAPVASNFAAAIVQILLLDIVFSIDSILTAVGMTDELAIMFAAVIIAVAVMLLAADPLADFINRNPSVVMLALGFLLMIGMTLIADGFGVHVPRAYIYAAMGFSAGVEALNMLSRSARSKRGPGGHDSPSN